MIPDGYATKISPSISKRTPVFEIKLVEETSTLISTSFVVFRKASVAISVTDDGTVKDELVLTLE